MGGVSREWAETWMLLSREISWCKWPLDGYVYSTLAVGSCSLLVSLCVSALTHPSLGDRHSLVLTSSVHFIYIDLCLLSFLLISFSLFCSFFFFTVYFKSFLKENASRVCLFNRHTTLWRVSFPCSFYLFLFALLSNISFIVSQIKNIISYFP